MLDQFSEDRHPDWLYSVGTRHECVIVVAVPSDVAARSGQSKTSKTGVILAHAGIHLELACSKQKANGFPLARE
jgi:hypothetical protein